MNTEQAYQAIALELVQFSGKRAWEHAQTRVRILATMLDVSWSICVAGKVTGATEDGGWPNWDKEISQEANDACRFLRDHFLAVTGDQIWGLTFTLYPDGKFKIEYDYNKPEGYEETDETITIDEAIKGIPPSSNS